MEVGIEVFNELGNYSWRDISASKDRSGFMTFMEFDSGHILRGGR